MSSFECVDLSTKCWVLPLRRGRLQTFDLHVTTRAFYLTCLVRHTYARCVVLRGSRSGFGLVMRLVAAVENAIEWALAYVPALLW